MLSRLIVCFLLAFGFSEARVGFGFSAIYDEFDFDNEYAVVVDGLCKDTCYVFASVTPESRAQAANLLIQTGKGFVSVADVADKKNATDGQKLGLQINNMASLTIQNTNSRLAAGPMILYVVNKAAPNFARAEIYEADGFHRPSAPASTVTVMSAEPFILRQAKSDTSQHVAAHLAGFDTATFSSDGPCPNVYKLARGPFPGYSLEINAPIATLLFDADEFPAPPGELSATLGIQRRQYIEPDGFFTSPGFHGCPGKKEYASSLYDTFSNERCELLSVLKTTIIVDVITNADESHPVHVVDGATGVEQLVYGTGDYTPVTNAYHTNNLTFTWHPDGFSDYHWMIRYNSTIPL